MTEPASFLVHDADVPNLRGIVSKLAGIGYSESSIRNRLGLEDVGDLQWRAVPMYRSEHLASRDSLALAIDLFLLQGALSAGELDRLFTRSERDVLVRAGILALDEAGLARVRSSLFPVGDRLIFSDHAWPELPHPGYDPVPYDQVMSVGRDSRNLARCTIRRPFRSALDLCTGSGIHAVLASTHSEQVLAVDINPRAARCTRFNAQALGITNLEIVVGDLFEAMPSKRFDLITANPPFVPSPLDSLRFRDGGRSGEDIQKRIVTGLPHHLDPGGIAQIVTELGERDGEPLVHRLREWLNGAAMDIHILRLGEHNAMQYAIGHAKGNDYQTFLDSADEWASNLRAQGYIRVVSLIISFQWSDAKCGSSWERVDESPPPNRAAGAEIGAAFLAERLTRRLDWQQILENSRLHRAGSIALLDARVLGSDLSAKVKAILLGKALRIEHEIDPVEREILNRMEGRIFASDLIATFRDLHVDEPIVIAALRSLLRCNLILVDE
ncbi:MAG: methyltransferase [Terriglobales bacterium]|jgi:methylase of polypeptide subunit release factors